MLNNCSFVGRLTADPELRYSPQGVAFSTFTLAVDDSYSSDSKPDFIPFVIWRQNAEWAANNVRKGDLVGATGRLKSKTYQNSENKNVSVLEVHGSDIRLLSKSAKNRHSSQTSPASPEDAGAQQ